MVFDMEPAGLYVAYFPLQYIGTEEPLNKKIAASHCFRSSIRKLSIFKWTGRGKDKACS